MKRKSQNKPGSVQRTGLERIEILFKNADDDFLENPERSHRNVQLARKIAMRYNITIPSQLKKKYCQKCYKYLKSNINCIITNTKGMETIKCKECGNITKRSRAKKQGGFE